MFADLDVRRQKLLRASGGLEDHAVSQLVNRDNEFCERYYRHLGKVENEIKREGRREWIDKPLD
jgi:hypothetical protein